MGIIDVHVEAFEQIVRYVTPRLELWNLLCRHADDRLTRIPALRQRTLGDVEPARTFEDLATLLDPQTPEDRAQAQALGRHLKAPNILTRSTYHSTTGASTSLESIILQQRRQSSATPSSSYSSCVVCQSATRTIIVWPCRCLALCEDCRVCLAHNNYKSCVCCRQGVEGFSRIYVP